MAAALFVLSLLGAASARNDWSKPCVSGTCSYDLPSTATSTSSGSIQLFASSHTSIGDITEAAGWQILGCNSTALTQDIRLVCMGGKHTKNCQHLFSGHGAVDTIARLPENCGASPFARIARSWIPEDQSIPEHIKRRLAVYRRQDDDDDSDSDSDDSGGDDGTSDASDADSDNTDDSSDPTVQAVTIDTNFGAANSSNTGTVTLAIKGINVPGLDQSIGVDNTTSSRRRSRLNKRQSTLQSLTNFVNNAEDSISSAVSSAASDVEDAASDVANAASAINNVNINTSQKLPAINFAKEFPLFEKELECGPASVEFKIDLNTKANAVITLGVAATGTIVPPEITDFSLIASMTADLNAELEMSADLTGSISSGNIQLFSAPIAGLDFPGILTVGPTFEINANAKATLDLAADLTLGINYHIDNAQMFFPPNSAKQSGGQFQLGDTPLKLSADTSITATGTVEAHLIPSLNLGLQALGVVQATVNLDLDASATMQLKVEAKAGASETIQQANSSSSDSGDSDSSDQDTSDQDASDDSDNSDDADVDDSQRRSHPRDFASFPKRQDDDDDNDSDSDSGIDDGSDSVDGGDDGSSDAGSSDVGEDTFDGSSDADDSVDDGTGDDDDSGDATDDGASDTGDDSVDDGTADDGSGDATDTAGDNSLDVGDDGDDDTGDAGDADDSGADNSTDPGDDGTAEDADSDDSDSVDAGDDTADADSDDSDATAVDGDDTSTDGDADSDDADQDIDGTDANSTDPSADVDGDDDDDSLDAGNSTLADGGASDDLSDSSNSTLADGDDLSGDSNSTSLDDGSNSNSTDPDDGSSNSTSTITSSASSTSATATSTSTSSAPKVSATGKTEASFSGSFTISAGIELSAGATGTFFKLFDKSTKVSLFKKDFELLSKSFGNSGEGEGGDSGSADGDSDSTRRRRRFPRKLRRFTPRLDRAARLLLPRDLSCSVKSENSTESGEKTSLADQTVPSESLN